MATDTRFNLKIKDYIGTAGGKRTYNEQHFSEAVSRYDFATRAMSLGRDRSWKKALIAALPKISQPACVDLACGTGDITTMLAEKYPDGNIVGIDLTEEMLQLARRRQQATNLSYRRADMAETGLADAEVDIVTGSYAIRNAPDLNEVFQEISRVLKPGGIVALLDFSKPPSRWFQRAQYLVLKYWCGFWGLLLHANPEIHSYIAASLKAFPDRDELRSLLAGYGLIAVESRSFYFGTLELLILQKQPLSA